MIAEVAALVALVASLVLLAHRRAYSRHLRRRAQRELSASLVAAQADLERLAEELEALDLQVASARDDSLATEHALAHATLDRARDLLANARTAHDIEAATEVIEEGCYVACCVRARVAHRQRPTRRPPCFFNPAHGPSERTVEWLPREGSPRCVPACAEDAARVASGADPYIRTVQRDGQRVPYWEGDRRYAPWVLGYFAAWRGSGLLGDADQVPLLRSSLDETLAS